MQLWVLDVNLIETFRLARLKAFKPAFGSYIEHARLLYHLSAWDVSSLHSDMCSFWSEAPWALVNEEWRTKSPPGLCKWCKGIFKTSCWRTFCFLGAEYFIPADVSIIQDETCSSLPDACAREAVLKRISVYFKFHSERKQQIFPLPSVSWRQWMFSSAALWEIGFLRVQMICVCEERWALSPPHDVLQH